MSVRVPSGCIQLRPDPLIKTQYLYCPHRPDSSGSILTRPKIFVGMNVGVSMMPKLKPSPESHPQQALSAAKVRTVSKPGRPVGVRGVRRGCGARAESDSRARECRLSQSAAEGKSPRPTSRDRRSREGRQIETGRLQRSRYCPTSELGKSTVSAILSA